MPLLGYSAALELLEHGLASRGRCLTDTQKQYVAETFQSSENLTPLFVMILLDETHIWKSYSMIGQEHRLQTTVQEAIQWMFGKLETKHGEILVKHALGYISTSKSIGTVAK